MLPSEIPWVLHAGNGTRGPFPLAFEGVPITYADRTHIRVTRYTTALIPTLQVNGTHYQLSALTALPDLGDPDRPVATASLTFKNTENVLAEGEFVLIERISPASQDLKLLTGGGFSSKSAETTFDAIVRVIQQVVYALTRTITLNRLDEAGALELPRAEDRASKFLRFDTDGNIEVVAADPGFGDMLGANNLSDIQDSEEARDNLELGSAALLNANAVFQVANNLNEGSASSIRANLAVPSTAEVSAAITAAVDAIKGGVSSAFDTLSEIATDLNLKALKATLISTAGLATGGGSLASDRTITVSAATASEARAMLLSTTALTPSNLADVGVGRVVAHSAVAQSYTGGTGENVFVTTAIAAGDIGANGWIEVETVWSVTNNANTKTPRVRFGASGAGTGGTAYFAPSAFGNIAGGRHIAVIRNRNSVSSQVGGLAAVNSTGFGTAGGSLPTSSINTANASEVVISGQLGTGTDTITLESYTIRVFKRA